MLGSARSWQWKIGVGLASGDGSVGAIRRGSFESSWNSSAWLSRTGGAGGGASFSATRAAAVFIRHVVALAILQLRFHLAEGRPDDFQNRIHWQLRVGSIALLGTVVAKAVCGVTTEYQPPVLPKNAPVLPDEAQPNAGSAMAAKMKGGRGILLVAVNETYSCRLALVQTDPDKVFAAAGHRKTSRRFCARVIFFCRYRRPSLVESCD